MQVRILPERKLCSQLFPFVTRLSIIKNAIKLLNLLNGVVEESYFASDVGVAGSSPAGRFIFP